MPTKKSTNTETGIKPPVKQTPEQFDPVHEYQNQIKQTLNARYESIVKRLDKETNIINRYELKLSLESILQVYKDLFPEG